MNIPLQIGDWNSNSWFQQMALKYCGKTYGSTLRNVYFFYRKVYRMSALEAITQARTWANR